MCRGGDYLCTTSLNWHSKMLYTCLEFVMATTRKLTFPFLQMAHLWRISVEECRYGRAK